MKLKIDNIICFPHQTEEQIPNLIQEKYSLKVPFKIKILRKSLDARNKAEIHYRYAVVIEIAEHHGQPLLKHENITVYEPPVPFTAPRISGNAKILIIGSGPAGLFCALRFLEYGLNVTVLEQGKPIEERIKDINRLESKGVLNRQSNVLFGEGGAGTYSDGKLTTRTNRPESRWLFDQLIRFGAPAHIAYQAKPHIGSDLLRTIIPNIRKSLAREGSAIIFNALVTDLLVHKNRIIGVVTADNREFPCSHLILATGHSARHTYAALSKREVALEKKGFAVGYRIEHPEKLIRKIQYGRSVYAEELPSAEYRLAWNNKAGGRGIYSFCMCPGGMVVNSSSEEKMLCVNGMSYSKRNMRHSNAALVVTVSPEDIRGDALAGIAFQRKMEARAFSAGGGGFAAPAQRVTDFLADKISASLPPSSYRPSVTSADMGKILPAWIIRELKQALPKFNQRMKGFITDEALLIGVESRTSSPVRITRNRGFESPSHQGLYPAGEGSGYAGGIVSSAVDGIRIADAVVKRLI